MTKDDLHRHIAHKIRSLRTSFGCACNVRHGHHKLSQEDVAVALGVTTNTVSRWETAVYWPAPYDLYKLAEYFGVPVADFFPPSGLGISPRKKARP